MKPLLESEGQSRGDAVPSSLPTVPQNHQTVNATVCQNEVITTSPSSSSSTSIKYDDNVPKSVASVSLTNSNNSPTTKDINLQHNLSNGNNINLQHQCATKYKVDGVNLATKSTSALLTTQKIPTKQIEVKENKELYINIKDANKKGIYTTNINKDKNIKTIITIPTRSNKPIYNTNKSNTNNNNNNSSITNHIFNKYDHLISSGVPFNLIDNYQRKKHFSGTSYRSTPQLKYSRNTAKSTENLFYGSSRSSTGKSAFVRKVKSQFSMYI